MTTSLGMVLLAGELRIELLMRLLIRWREMCTQTVQVSRLLRAVTTSSQRRHGSCDHMLKCALHDAANNGSGALSHWKQSYAHFKGRPLQGALLPQVWTAGSSRRMHTHTSILDRLHIYISKEATMFMTMQVCLYT